MSRRRRRIAEAACADESTRPVGRGVGLHANDTSRAGCVDEASIAKRDAHVRGAAAHGFKEHEIARLHLVQIDGLSVLVLRSDLARQGRAVLREDVLDEPAAIEAGRIAPAVAVGGAKKRQRRLNDLIGRFGLSRCGRWLSAPGSGAAFGDPGVGWAGWSGSGASGDAVATGNGRGTPPRAAHAPLMMATRGSRRIRATLSQLRYRCNSLCSLVFG